MATGEVSAHVLAGKAVTLARIQTSCHTDSSLTVASIEQSVLGAGNPVSEYMPSNPVQRQKAEAGRMCRLEANLGHNALPNLKLDARSKGRECEPRNVAPP